MLDHLIARFQIESEWPDCTNWDGPEAGEFPQNIEWADSIGHIQESGRNVVSPGQTLTETRFLIVLRGDPEPRFSNWSLDFDFAAAQPPPASQSGAPGSAAATPTATAEQETVFWQSIMNSTNAAEFEVYLEQFPNGVFRLLAQSRLAALRAPTGDRPASGGGSSAAGSRTAADRDAPLRAGETQVFDGMEFVWVPAGEFRMGSTSSEADNDRGSPVYASAHQPGIRSGQVRGDAGAVGGSDGEQPVIFQGMRIGLPCVECFVGGCAGVYWEAQRDGWSGNVPVADGGGVGIRGAGGDDRGSLRREPGRDRVV